MCIETNLIKPKVMLTIGIDFSYFYIQIFVYIFICVIDFMV